MGKPYKSGQRELLFRMIINFNAVKQQQKAIIAEKRQCLHCITSLAVAGWTAGQTIYNALNYYKPMTDDYDVRLRGTLFLPPCVKDLMNCWEILRQDLVCRYGMIYRIALESMCMDLRFQCKEHTGALPFKSLNVTTWNFCPPTLEQNKQINLQPIDPLSRNDVMGVNNS